MQRASTSVSGVGDATGQQETLRSVAEQVAVDMKRCPSPPRGRLQLRIEAAKDNKARVYYGEAYGLGHSGGWRKHD